MGDTYKGEQAMKKLEMTVENDIKLGMIKRYANEQQTHDKINEIIEILYQLREENTKLKNRLFLVEDHNLPKENK